MDVDTTFLREVLQMWKQTQSLGHLFKVQAWVQTQAASIPHMDALPWTHTTPGSSPRAASRQVPKHGGWGG